MTRSLWSGAASRLVIVSVILFLLLPLALPAAVGPEAARAIAELADSDWQVRADAARTLGEIGQTDRSITDALTNALEDDNSRVRRAAAASLGQLGPKASRSMPALLERFDDIDPGVAAAAATAVGNMGSRASRVVPELRTLLGHGDERVQTAAAEALGKIGPRAGKGAADLGAQLEDGDASVRIAAAEALGRLGSKAESQSDRLVRLLHDADPQVRKTAAEALVQIGEDAVPSLIRALSKGDPVFLQAVVATLGDMGSVAVPRLTRSLHAQHAELLERRYSALALAQIGAADRKVIPALVEALDDGNPDVRVAALEALGLVGRPAAEATEQVIDLAVDQRQPILVRENALAAMARIAPTDAAVRRTLVDSVADGNPDIYAAAVAALVEARGREAHTTDIAELIRQLDSGSGDTRVAAARQLGELGSFAASAVPGLTNALADAGNGSRLRASAAMALGMIGPAAEAAVPELIRSLEDDSEQLRDAALVALDRIGPQSQTIPALLEAMRFGSLETQAAAAQKVRSFARARKQSWQSLLSQSDAPVLRNWLNRYDELYGVAVPPAELAARRGEVDGPDYFDVMGGRAAIRESMQLDLIANPLSGSGDSRSIDVADIEAVRVDSHPFEEMLEDSKGEGRRVALAELVPPDRAFAWFRDIASLREAFAEAADQFLRFESVLSVKSVEYDVEQRYLDRLGLSDDRIRQVQALAGIGDLAIVAPDLFLVDGTDITIIATLTSPQLTQSVLGLLGLTPHAAGEYSSHTLDNDDVVYWAVRGSILVISSSAGELRNVLALHDKSGEDSLGKSAEFRYMQQQIGIEAQTSAYLYFSDAFIRRLVSPEVKIAQLRRMQARAEMEMLVSAAMLYVLDGNRHIPSKEQLIRHRYLPSYFEYRDYSIDNKLFATSRQYGAVARLKPLSANPVITVTRRERDAYRRFVDDYSRYWSQFFDPIAVRFDEFDDGTSELTSFILPLPDSDLYMEVREALASSETGQRLAAPVLSPTPSMALSVNLSDDVRIELSRQLAGMLVRYTSVDPEIFDSIGSGIHLAVRDSTPIVALGSGDVWGALNREMLRLGGFDSLLPFLLPVLTQPAAVMIELTDAERVREFLADAVALDSDSSGQGQLHKLQDKEAWIYTLNIEDIVQVHLRVEIKQDFLVISNLPWSEQFSIEGVTETVLNGAKMQVNLDEIEQQLPALHTKVFADYRAAAVDGMGYLYPLIVTGLSDTVDDALEQHFLLFGFRPLHPSTGRWLWRGSHLESSEFGTASYPVQPEYTEGERDFGLFPALSMLSVNMQLEDTGLRATIRWQAR